MRQKRPNPLTRNELRGLGRACEQLMEAAHLLTMTNWQAAPACGLLLRKAYEEVAAVYLKNEIYLPACDRKGPASANSGGGGAEQGAQGAAPAAGASSGANEG